MQRGAWDFALASIAAIRRDDGSVRMAMGGVAPRPWRVPESVEEDVASGGLDEDSIAALAERGREAILAGDRAALGELMSANVELRSRIMSLDPRHLRMVELARSLGCHANYAGSG
jgi:hypothetical protein